MITRIRYWIFLFITPFYASSQVTTDSILMEKFVVVYFQEKDIHKELVKKFEQKIRSLAIDSELYQEYRDRKKEQITLSQELQLVENEVQAIKSEFEKNKNTALEAICKQEALDHSLYGSLKKRYLHEIAFNRACQRFVNAYLNAIKDE